MSVATHDAGRLPTATSILRAWLRAMRMGIEAHTRYRMQSALSPSQFHQADREIRRCRRLMRAGN